jgi:hypothetical protein
MLEDDDDDKPQRHTTTTITWVYRPRLRHSLLGTWRKVLFLRLQLHISTCLRNDPFCNHHSFILVVLIFGLSSFSPPLSEGWQSHSWKAIVDHQHLVVVRTTIARPVCWPTRQSMRPNLRRIGTFSIMRKYVPYFMAVPNLS